jgi:glycosyltransferase involved in cell wall biosynthesis
LIVKRKTLPARYVTITFGTNSIKVYSPRFVSFGKKNRFLAELGYRLKEFVVLRQYKKIGVEFDAVYAHFYSSGRTAKAIHEKFDVPFFTAHGESRFIEQFNDYPLKDVKEFYHSTSGIIAVSSHIKRHILKTFGMEEEKILVAPNGINVNLFKPQEKALARTALGIDQNITMAIAVGSLIKRKGPSRIVAAVEDIPNLHVFFIGKLGDDVPRESDTIHVLGEKNQKQIVQYLSAADMFVLPTLAEGSCNAIIEALACGLPIISSKRDFNEDVLDDSCAILIDPVDVGQIHNAVDRLAGDEAQRKNMSYAALERAKHLDIQERTKRILSFIENRI